MKTPSASSPNRLSLGCAILAMATCSPSLQVTAQSAPSKDGPDISRLPKINVQSPLLAIPTKSDGEKDKAKDAAAPPTTPAPTTPASAKPATGDKKAAPVPPAAAAAVEKPQMKVPAENAAPPTVAKPAAAAGAGGANQAPSLLPPTNPPKLMSLSPDDPNLIPLPPIPQEAPVAVQIDPNQPIISSLSGITMFKDDRKDVSEAPSAVPTTAGPGINIAPDLTTPEREALVAMLQEKYVGKPLSFNGLDQIVKDILAHYSARKRPMTHVYIPEQDVNDTVKIAVLEGRLGEIRYSGNENKRRWFQAPLPKVPEALEAQKGQILDMNSITSAVSELNLSPWSRLGRKDAHPYRSASVALSPGEQLGLTDVELAVQSRKIVPIQAFAGWDNTGTVVLGENRFNMGMVWYDAFNTGYDHQFGFQVQSAENYDLFHAIIASYQIPIRSLNSTLQFFGAYMQSSVNIPAAGVPQFIEGDAMILGGRYFYHLPSWFITEAAKTAEDKTKQLALYHEIGFGFDYKSQTNNLFFGGVNVFPTQIEVAQYVAEYNLRQTDKWGETTAGLSYFYSPGSITRNNTDVDFLTARTGGTADYSYFRGNFSRLLDLGAITKHLNDVKFLVRGTGQWSTANLVASEQLGLGGQDSVRGYPERTMRGDRGLFLQAELYSPALHPLKWLAKKTPDRWMDVEQRTDELRFLFFYDYGWGDVFNPTAAESGEILNLSSIGVGLRYRYNKSMTFRFDYGYQLEKLDPTRVNAFDLSPKYSNSGDGYAHMGLSLSF